MLKFVYSHFEHCLFVLLLISRLGDIISTYLATPTLKLEANPLARRLRWPFAVCTVLVSFIAYFNTFIAVVMLVPFLFVSASNLSRVWLIRALGEDAYLDLLLTAAWRTKLWQAVAGIIAASSFMALAGFVLYILSGNDWGWPFSIGIIFYSLVQAFYGTLFCIRIFATAHRTTHSKQAI